MYNAPTPSRRRRQFSGDDHGLERAPGAPVPQWTRLERAMPSYYEEYTLPTAVTPLAPSSRRARHREAEVITAPKVFEEEVVPIAAEVAPQQRTSRYSQSPPRMDSREEDDIYSGQQPTRRDEDQGSDRSRSRSRMPYYGGSGGDWPRFHAYKSGDAEVYVMDDGQNDRGIRPPSPMGEDLDAYDEFNFLFPTADSKGEELSDLESPVVDSDSAHREERDVLGTSSAKRIYSSRYTGSAELGGTHTAKLTEIFDVKAKKRPLFKWL